MPLHGTKDIVLYIGVSLNEQIGAVQDMYVLKTVKSEKAALHFLSSMAFD